MERPNQDAIETFMSITGTSEPVALLKLQEHGGNLNQAVNAHFSEGERTINPIPQDDFMAIDDPIQDEFDGPHQHLLSAARNPNTSTPHSTIADVSASGYAHEMEAHESVGVVDNQHGDLTVAHAAPAVARTEGIHVYDRLPAESVPQLNSATDYGNEIEEQMVQAAIEASKRDVGEGYPNHQFGFLDRSSGPWIERRPSRAEDVELEDAVSLSTENLDREKTHCEQRGVLGTAEQVGFSSPGVQDLGRLEAANGRQEFDPSNTESSSQFKLEAGNTSVQNDAEDVEEQPLVTHRSRPYAFGAVESAEEIGEMVDSAPSRPGTHDIMSHPQNNGHATHSDEWGGMSSEEHDEAVMLEAAIFGGIPDGNMYHFAYPHNRVPETNSDGNADFYTSPLPRLPSPTLTAQRLLREQQDSEYLAALQADREKELKAVEEAEIRCLEEAAKREAALEEEKQQQEESCRRLREEEEYERLIGAKQASLPQEPAPDDMTAVTLVVRMSDGSRRGRRFLKSDKLQSLFDFVDIGRGVKPGAYRLVRPYPRRAFSDNESGLSLRELGLTSKQEALFLEPI